MQEHTINVRESALSTAVSTVHQLSNQITLCRDALAHHSDGSAVLGPIIETLSKCASELQQLRSELDILVSDGKGGEA